MDMENRNHGTKKRIILFAVLSIVIGWGTFSLIPLLKIPYGQGASVGILMVMMFSPTLSSLLTRLITKEGFKNMYLRPNFKGNIRSYLLIFFGPSILLLVSGVVYFLVFPKMFDPQLTQLKGMLEANGPEGLTPISILIVSILQIIIVGPIINIVPTMGEELGWRGYLLPKLRKLYSDRTSLVISGAFWGFWHLPAILMGHNYGTDYVGYPWLGVLAMIIFCIVLGIIEGYATIKLGSVIPAAMIHSTLNAGAALPMMLANEGYNTLIGPAVTGLIGGMPLIILAVVLLLKSNSSKEGL